MNEQIIQGTDEWKRLRLPDEAAARKAADDQIRDGTRMIALFEVKALLVPEIQVKEISPLPSTESGGARE